MSVHKNYIAAPKTPPTITTTEKLDDWDEYLAAGTSSNPEAAVQIVEVAEYECPFCKRFHEILKELEGTREFGLTVGPGLLAVVLWRFLPRRCTVLLRRPGFVVSQQ